MADFVDKVENLYLVVSIVEWHFDHIKFEKLNFIHASFLVLDSKKIHTMVHVRLYQQNRHLADIRSVSRSKQFTELFKSLSPHCRHPAKLVRLPGWGQQRLYGDPIISFRLFSKSSWRRPELLYRPWQQVQFAMGLNFHKVPGIDVWTRSASKVDGASISVTLSLRQDQFIFQVYPFPPVYLPPPNTR